MAGDEKYNLQLEGDEIDEALLRLSRYDDEAWTKGTRKGVPVQSNDETYHNNAYFYTQQASTAIQSSIVGKTLYVTLGGEEE